tara:strand:+ start:32 stop:193 length:162 start_codon:yes stop_codon:yes gene_type:complete
VTLLIPTVAKVLKNLAADAATERLIRALSEIDSSLIRRLVIQMLQDIHSAHAP